MKPTTEDLEKDNVISEQDNQCAEQVEEQVAEQTAEAQVSEEVDNENTSDEASAEESLHAALAEAEEKIAAEHDKYLRQMAEFENYRKRTLKEKSELILNGSANLMTAILPIIDDMDRALDALTKTDDPAACCEGFKLIASKFRTTLEQNGLKQMDTKDKPFDTDFHEAIAQIPATDESQKGLIMDCVQPGYMLNDKVLRYAKVAVYD